MIFICCCPKKQQEKKGLRHIPPNFHASRSQPFLSSTIQGKILPHTHTHTSILHLSKTQKMGKSLFLHGCYGYLAPARRKTPLHSITIIIIIMLLSHLHTNNRVLPARNVHSRTLIYKLLATLCGWCFKTFPTHTHPSLAAWYNVSCFSISPLSAGWPSPFWGWFFEDSVIGWLWSDIIIDTTGVEEENGRKGEYVTKNGWKFAPQLCVEVCQHRSPSHSRCHFARTDLSHAERRIVQDTESSPLFTTTEGCFFFCIFMRVARWKMRFSYVLLVGVCVLERPGKSNTPPKDSTCTKTMIQWRACSGAPTLFRFDGGGLVDGAKCFIYLWMLFHVPYFFLFFRNPPSFSSVVL